MQITLPDIGLLLSLYAGFWFHFFLTLLSYFCCLLFSFYFHFNFPFISPSSFLYSLFIIYLWYARDYVQIVFSVR